MIDRSISSKILFVGPDVDSPKGGIGMVLSQYKQFISPFNHIVTHKDGGKFRKTVTYIKALAILVYWLMTKEIKIVHVHGSIKGSFIRKSIIIILSHLFGKSIIYHIHSGGIIEFAKKNKRAIRFVFNKCDVIVALSDTWKQYFENTFHHPNVIVIPNIIPQPTDNIGSQAAEKCTFLFLGKICKEKGIFDFLDVLRDNKERYKNKLLFRVGGNGDTKLFEKTVEEYGLSDMVVFEGWVSGSAKERLLNSSNVLVLTSYFEGIPISILEAFSYHMPVLASKVGGIPDIVTNNKNGILVSPGNKEEICRGIDTFIGNKDKILEMGENGYETAKNHFPNSVERVLNELYGKLDSKMML